MPFGDPTGLDKRNVASSNDLVKMVRAAGNYDVIRRFTTTKSYDFFVANNSSGNRTYKANNTSSLVRSGDYQLVSQKLALSMKQDVVWSWRLASIIVLPLLLF